MGTVATGLMQINRDHDEILCNLDSATTTEGLKLIMQTNMEKSASQARAGWSATNRIDSLIEQMETMQKSMGDNISIINKGFDDI